MPRQILLRLAILLIGSLGFTACEPAGTSSVDKSTLGWLTSYEDGLTKAKAENKPMLLEFTGSDWCSWCMKLSSEVFQQPKFQEYAKEKLVLVELDFPRGKSVPADVRDKREALRKQLGVQGFPTVIVFSPEGKELERLGYKRGGPDVFLADVERATKR